MKTPMLALLAAAALPAQSLEQIAQSQLADRTRTLAAIQTPKQLAARQRFVREKVLELIGGLPKYKGPLAPKVTGEIQREGFVIEKVLFQSLPDLWVSANVYRPAQPGRYPAVLIPMGHWDEGKAAAQLIASNLALKGFVAMPFDPLGQGERQQQADRATGKSRIGGSVDQHFMAGAQSILLGQSFARYRIHDAMRGIDYLQSRSDVDPLRIGVTGCSGGGTVTAYVAALDDRVRVAAPACYITSFQKLFSGPVGDSEQSFYRFLSSGLDQGDYLLAFAPRPLLIASTEKDFFPIEGTRLVYEETRRWYAMLEANPRLKWVVGPGEHGTPIEVREAIYEWFIRWMKNGQGDAKERAVDALPEKQLRVTESGLVPGREIWQVIGETPLQRGSPGDLRAAIRHWVSNEPRSKAAPPGATVTINVRQEPGSPRGLVGHWETSTRAMLVGRTLPGLRAAELIRKVDEANAPVELVAKGPSGIAALLAAALDPRIVRVRLSGTPKSLRSLLRGPVAANIYEGLLPGFALKWDVDDLVAEIGRDRVHFE